MPRGDVAGTGSGSERRACDHRVCLSELWSKEIGGPRTSAYYRETLTRTLIKLPPHKTSGRQPRRPSVIRLTLIKRSRPKKIWVFIFCCDHPLNHYSQLHKS